MKNHLLIITSIAAFSGAAVAGQQTSFEGLDADTNGYISQQEAMANDALTTQWGALDANSDNQLDQSEFSAFEIENPAGSMESPEAVE